VLKEAGLETVDIKKDPKSFAMYLTVTTRKKH
jgi:hypothetical protein